MASISLNLAAVCLIVTLLALKTTETEAVDKPPLLNDKPTVMAQIDAFVNDVMKCRNVTGLVIAAVNGSTVLLSKGYGLAEVEVNRPVTTSTLFPLGSLTKGFTAVLLAMMLRENNRTWDTPVRDILGDDFQLYDDTLTSLATVGDLLSHRLGLPGYFLPLLAGSFRNKSRKDMSRSLKYHQPIYGLRRRFIYSNFPYITAGLVAETLAAVPVSWEELTISRIFRPLNMTSSTFVSELRGGEEMTRLAAPYCLAGDRLATGSSSSSNSAFSRINETLLHQVDVAAPAGAIVSTAEDVALWMQFLLKGGRTSDGRHLLTEEDLVDMFGNQMHGPIIINDRDLLLPTFPISDVIASYGFGWVTSIYRGYRRAWHSGAILNYRSRLALFTDPGVNMGVFVAANGATGEGSSTGERLILSYVSDVLLGLQPWLNSTTACSFPLPWEDAASLFATSPRPRGDWTTVSTTTVATTTRSSKSDQDTNLLRRQLLPNFVGTYAHEGFGYIRISLVPISATVKGSQCWNQSIDGEQTLALKMGDYLEGCLLPEEESTTAFTLSAHGVYWWFRDRVPVTFVTSSSSNDVTALNITLYAPYSTAQFTRFDKVHLTSAASTSCYCQEWVKLFALVTLILTFNSCA